jgi:hypothetical protein
MRAEELAAEFGITRFLDFVETGHRLVKTAISLDGRLVDPSRRVHHAAMRAVWRAGRLG